MSSSWDSGAGLRKGADRFGGIKCDAEAEDRKRRKDVVRRVSTPVMKQKRVRAPALMSRRREKLDHVGVVGGELAYILLAIGRRLLWYYLVRIDSFKLKIRACRSAASFQRQRALARAPLVERPVAFVLSV